MSHALRYKRLRNSSTLELYKLWQNNHKLLTHLRALLIYFFHDHLLPCHCWNSNICLIYYWFFYWVSQPPSLSLIFCRDLEKIIAIVTSMQHLCNSELKILQTRLTASRWICRIFGWNPPRVPLSWFLPLWHFTDTVIVILLPWWANVFRPFTTGGHAGSSCSPLVIFITSTNTNVQATSPIFLISINSLMVASFSFNVFATLLLWRYDNIWNYF